MMNRRKNIIAHSTDTGGEKHSFAKIMPIFFQYRWMIGITVITAIIFNLSGLVMPWMLKIAIDKVLPNSDYILFWILFFFMLVIYTMRFFLRYITVYLMDYVGVRMIIDIRKKVFNHLQSLSLRFYQEYRTGKLISNVISDVGLLNSLLQVTQTTIEQVFQLLLVMGLLFFINWQMTLFVICVMPLFYLNFAISKRLLRRDAMQIQEQLSEVSANLSESLTGMKVVKSFAKEHAESLRFFKSMRPVIDLQMMQTVHKVQLNSVNDVMTMLTYLFTIFFGIRYIQSGAVSMGEFVAFYTYVGAMLGPVNALSGLSQTFAAGIVGASRIINILNVIPDVREVKNPIQPNNMKGLIEFKDVCFKYTDAADKPTIQDFNLTVQPGQKVALVGPSGSGKSTISNLLLRFYDVTSGMICVDGVDIRRFGFDNYRKHLGIVLQDPFLFSGTIRENIAYANEKATDEEIEAAAKLANVEEFVLHLPDGYETVIGENGATLSGGQKQRIAIARAILNNPTILILDEATSALDTVSEFLVQQALDRLMEGKTTIIIAHRLSTIQNADVIVVLSEGKIVEKGTHEELLAKGGTYKELYRTQKKMAQSQYKDEAAK